MVESSAQNWGICIIPLSLQGPQIIVEVGEKRLYEPKLVDVWSKILLDGSLRAFVDTKTEQL